MSTLRKVSYNLKPDKFYPVRLFQNFSFWNSFPEFNGKTGLWAGFSKSLSKTNRVLEQARLSTNIRFPKRFKIYEHQARIFLLNLRINK
jgi:hypothetical protein